MIREYQCDKCEAVIEVFEKLNDSAVGEPHTDCELHGTLVRILSPTKGKMGHAHIKWEAGMKPSDFAKQRD